MPEGRERHNIIGIIDDALGKACPHLRPGGRAVAGKARRAAQAGPGYPRIAKWLQGDALLCYRLFEGIAEQSVDGCKPMASVREAVRRFGGARLREWLPRALQPHTPPPSAELAFLAAQRGRFFEFCAARAIGAAPQECERVQLLGLFSLLDRQLDKPMRQALAPLPLDAELKRCLVGKDSDLKPWLTLVRCFEDADWEDFDAAAAALGLSAGQASACYAESMRWAQAAFAGLE